MAVDSCSRLRYPKQPAHAPAARYTLPCAACQWTPTEGSRSAPYAMLCHNYTENVCSLATAYVTWLKPCYLAFQRLRTAADLVVYAATHTFTGWRGVARGVVNYHPVTSWTSWALAHNLSLSSLRVRLWQDRSSQITVRGKASVFTALICVIPVASSGAIRVTGNSADAPSGRKPNRFFITAPALIRPIRYAHICRWSPPRTD
jgi:hypothetical protein